MSNSRLFRRYGELCATHPWEVIVAVLTLTTIFLTGDHRHKPLIPKESKDCPGCYEDQFHAADVIVMTIVRCLAILYTYHQFRNLHKMGSKYILGFAGLFTVFSSFVFTSTAMNFLHIQLVDLKDALFFFLLLIDLSKAATLAQFALTASNQEEITEQIGRGMSVLGPSMTLNTVVETLVIGVGTLSGVPRLERISYFACFSVIVNYVTLMTFYPSFLSLILELTKITNVYGERRSIVSKMLEEEKDKSNPAAQRVKLIMSFGLLTVHILSRWSIFGAETPSEFKNKERLEDSSSFYSLIVKQFVMSADHIVILILLITLMIKFIFFESSDFAYERVDTGGQTENLSISQRKTPTASESLRPKIERQRSISTSSSMSFDKNELESVDTCRNLEVCLQLYRSKDGSANLTDKEIMLLVDTKHIPPYNLEKALNNLERGVAIRRKILEKSLGISKFENLPYKNYDYSSVQGSCCENVVGYVPVPLGVAGPLNVDGEMYYIPMATTEGCLVASTNRGCRAVEHCGIRSTIVADGMTRGPVVRFSSTTKASELVKWLNIKENFDNIKAKFDSTSRFAKLSKISARIAGRYVFLRFVAQTGDAMGMNMLSKGTEKALNYLQDCFNDMEILSLSGNYCTDKKPSSINWIEGRGKSVVCEAVVPAEIVSSVLKCTTSHMVDLNLSKNMIGSAMAGSIGGFNAHAANVVTAIFIATGQDPAQNIASSNCITIMEPWGPEGKDLYISCTMPSIEIGTIGGGTILPAQSSCLEMLGVRGPHQECPGDNAKKLARIVCAAVLAGELSLMAALATGHLVKSHLKYNRSCSERDTCDQSK
ncbi:3-hydroxy-3-methylglutaryl-coenzyme A reductase-like [Coccinella septempunctata]|uniref:3-hydroxy-3-methylglutaryl-coenzyme A reductase-like n=1 Tax=Coccinella septempunctata TaxID=41139 RepID=UPI001D096052|nr:3-hydroxy-3-methylglutaryl-coenzyme A reductase-like [Coccinella septempunctata]